MLCIEQYGLETIPQDASVKWLPESAIRERMRAAYSVEREVERRREFVRDLARGGTRDAEAADRRSAEVSTIMQVEYGPL
jgi:hypothetical protein